GDYDHPRTRHRKSARLERGAPLRKHVRRHRRGYEIAIAVDDPKPFETSSFRGDPLCREGHDATLPLFFIFGPVKIEVVIEGRLIYGETARARVSSVTASWCATPSSLSSNSGHDTFTSRASRAAPTAHGWHRSPPQPKLRDGAERRNDPRR